MPLGRRPGKKGRQYRILNQSRQEAADRADSKYRILKTPGREQLAGAASFRSQPSQTHITISKPRVSEYHPRSGTITAERVHEQFEGFVDEVRNGIAYITLVSNIGEEFHGEYDALELARLGIQEQSRFRCQTVEMESKGVEVRFTPLPPRVLTLDEQSAIDMRIDELLDGGEFDDEE